MAITHHPMSRVSIMKHLFYLSIPLLSSSLVFHRPLLHKRFGRNASSQGLRSATKRTAKATFMFDQCRPSDEHNFLDNEIRDHQGKSSVSNLTDRRVVLKAMVASLPISFSSFASPANAASSPELSKGQGLLLNPTSGRFADSQTSKGMENGMLETRVLENVLSPPPYGMETNDILYPNYFAGVWDVQSTTSSIEAPCGAALFGGNATYVNALKEVGTTLSYKSRFINGINSDTAKAATSTIADREYNVIEIAKAAMGPNSVLDVPLVSPNKLSCILSPSGAGGRIMQADLLTFARRQESISSCEFHCSEVVRQIISMPSDRSSSRSSSPPNVMTTARRGSLLKEVETVSLYNSIPPLDGGEVREIRCKQRSATFLLPSQDDPTAYRMWQMSAGRPIDVRYYDVTYTKR